MTRWLYLALVVGSGCGRLWFDAGSNTQDGGDAGGDAIDASSSMLRFSYIKPTNTDAFDNFGSAVALSADGTTLAVGAPNEDSGFITSGADNSLPQSGAVYVFVRANTTWVQQAYLKPQNLGNSDLFGFSLALSADGNTLAIGAPGEDSPSQTLPGSDTAPDAGAAYVFTRTGTTWQQQVYVKAAFPDTGDQFGWSVSLSATGDTLAIGAIDEDSSATGVDGTQTDNSVLGSGAAYVFTRSGSLWGQAAYFKAWNPGSNDNFGFSVGISGDGATLAVGAPGEDSSVGGVKAGPGPFADDNTVLEAGAAYVFTLAGTTWSQQAYIKASFVGFGGDYLARPLALSASGDVLACASPGSDTLVANSGSVWVFRRTGTTWAEEQELKASNAGDNDQFGAGLAIAGDGNEILAGAIFEDSNATGLDGDQTNDAYPDSGAAYVIDYSATGGWTQRVYVKSSAPSPNDQFGNALGVSANHQTRAVAAVFEDSAATGIDGNPNDESATDSGAVGLGFY